MATIVLCGGSADYGETVYTRAAFEFGRLVAREGWRLRTGAGSGRSIMGAATDGALSQGGRVEGVILTKFWRVRHRRLHSLKAYPTFAQRKKHLFRNGDAVAIFPGGYGTLDELGDILSLKQNGFTDVPVLLVDIKGYFAPLLRWIRKAEREGFLYGDSAFETAGTPAAAVRRLRTLLKRR